MATAAELVQAAGEGRIALKAAVAAAADRWESVAEGEEWTPRQVAEHVIGAERAVASMMAAAVGQEAPPPRELSLASASDATAAFDANSEACRAVFEAITDENLSAAAPLPDGAPFAKSVEGALTLVAWHYSDHTGQISKT